MKGAPEETGLIVPKRLRPPFDAAIARLAATQHGIVWHEQLLALGMTASGIRKRVAAGRLHRIHRGVYAVGHRSLTPHGRWLAAVESYGHAALAHRSALEHHMLLPRRPHPIHVVVPRLGAKSRKGIEVHCTRTLLRRDVVVKDKIPVTTVARSLLDFAEAATEAELAEAVEQAEIRRILDIAAIADVLDRSRGRRGAPALDAAVSHLHPLTKDTKSRLERRFLRMLADAGLPAPLVNKPLLLPNGITIKPDFHWPAHGLILETDGRETHLTPTAFERDRRRDQQLTLIGLRCPRTTWHQLDVQPGVVVALVAGLIRSEAA